MTQSGGDWSWPYRLMAAFGIGGAMICLSGDCALAQITPDGSLGAEHSTVKHDVNIKGLPSHQIDGGAQRGANLFHSFQEFNIEEERGAYFTNPTEIKNILSRVTGNSRSDIQGTLGVLGKANLFLINPNGIIFGPNASLDVGGSFVSTTANAVQFGEQGFFSATAPNALPLLTVNPSALLFNQMATQSITNQSATGLQVPAEQSLVFVGGDVSLEGGKLRAPGGQVELGGVAGIGKIGLNGSGSDLSLSFPENIGRADVSLTNRAEVDVRAGGGGSIAVNAQNLNVEGDSKLQAGIASGSGSFDSKAGDIEIDTTGTLTLAGATSKTQRSTIANNVQLNAKGEGGDIDIKTVVLSATGGGEVTTSTFGQGNAGNVTIDADKAFFSGEGPDPDYPSSSVASRVESEAKGKGGDIHINTGSLSVKDGAFITTSTDSNKKGNAGNIVIEADDTVIFDGVGPDDFSSGAYSQVLPEAKGKGGNIDIRAKALSVTNGARVSASTSGQGNAGNVTINTHEASFDGEGRDGYSSGAFSDVYPAAVGQGGKVDITTGSLSLTNGAVVRASTSGQGDAGDVRITARDTVSFDGERKNGIPSGAFGRVKAKAKGEGGHIQIKTGSFSVIDGAAIDVSTLGATRAGNITISARDKVTFSGPDSNASSEGSRRYEQGQGGNINVTAKSLFVTGGAFLNTGTFEGDGGDLTITTSDSVEVIGPPGRPLSFLRTQTSGVGDAGDLTITTGKLIAENGAYISTSAREKSTGNAGDLTLTAIDSVRLGTSGGSRVASQVAALTLGAQTGGDLTISTRQLVVQNGAEVTVSSKGSGKGGNLEVAAPSIQLDNRGKLTAEAVSVQGGNIVLHVPGLLQMRGNSRISATAGIAGVGGDGGNIDINPNTDNTDALIVAVPQEDSDITANAFEGQGGKIRIRAQGIFGLEERRAISGNKTNDIDASSQLGLPGTIELNTPDVDPSGGLVALPEEVVDVSGLITQTCPAGSRPPQSRFVFTGRGGLPPNPGEILNTDAVEVDLVTLNPRLESRSSPAISTNLNSSSAAPIVEAQGWIRDARGNVALIANAPAVNPHSSWQKTTKC